MKKFCLIFFIFFILGLIIFKLSFLYLPTTDAQTYSLLANNLVEGRGYSLGGKTELIFPPGLPFLLTPFIALGLSMDVAINLFFALTYLGLVLLVFYFLKSYSEKRTALITTIFIFLNGNFLLLLVNKQIELVWYLFLLAGGLFFYKKKYPLLVGFLWAFAYLIKPDTLGYLGVVYFCDLLSTKKIKRVVQTLPIVLLVVIGYSLFLHQSIGGWHLSGKMATLNWDQYVEMPSFNRDSLVYRLNSDLSIGVKAEDFSWEKISWMSRIQNNTLDFKQVVFELLLPLKIVLPIILLTFLLFKKKKVFKEFLFLMPLFSVLLFHVEKRYLIPILIFSIFWLVRNTEIDKKRITWIQRLGVVASLVSLILITYYSYLPLKVESINSKKERVGVNEMMGGLRNTEKIIYSRKPVYAYFLETDYSPLPYVNDCQQVNLFFEDKQGVIVLDNWSKYTLPKTDQCVRFKYFDTNEDKIVEIFL